MQICTIHISICMSCSLATAVARYICIMYCSGPAEVPMKEETTKLTWKLLARTTMWMKLHSLPRDSEVWTKGLASVEGRSWTSSSQQRWSVLGFTQYGSSCLEKDDDDFKNLSASLICVQLNLCSGKVHTHVFSNQPADS